MRLAFTIVLVLVASIGAIGCKKGGGGGGSWLVGEDGLMLQVPHDGSGAPGTYTLDSDADLLAIACRGAHDAWVVGEGGTLLRTLDAGATWDAIALDTDATLRAVAVAAEDRVYAAGDRGTLLVSRDSGDTWEPIDSGAADWRAVATTADGERALLAAADGSIWRYDDAARTLARAGDAGVALHGAAITADGARAAVVGDGGALLESADGGATWTPRELATERALRAVRLALAGDLLMAAGDGGVTVRIHRGEVEVAELLGDGIALHGLHLSADGHGMAVGDRGTLLHTADHGDGWSVLDLGDVGGALFGVDDLHGEPHL
jgi:photosystem II stability/assembly factor-like uncharacterized protein